MSDKVKAYNYLKHRGATRLCHFTKIKSLVYILDDDFGIRSTDLINPDYKINNQNDKLRKDNATDYVCCSLQYPNGWYWDKAKNRDEDTVFREWIVLCVDLAILKEVGCKFCPINAATDDGAKIRDDLENIKILFDTYVGKYPRPSSMLECCPSDGQAEILVHKYIPREFISGIIVGDENCANHVTSILLTYEKDIPVYIAPDVCNTGWNRIVRSGSVPLETQYVHRGE